MKQKALVLAAVALCLLSCKQLAYKKHIRDMSVSFGSSGGITGAKEEYILKGKGDLLQVRSFGKDTVQIKTIEKEALMDVFKMAESREAMGISLDTPGNLTNFISLYNGDRLLKSWQWAEGTEIPEEIKTLYSALNKLY